MKKSTSSQAIALLSIFANLVFGTGMNAFAEPPTMDGFNVQSFLKLSNNSPVSATSADFVFAVFKGNSCIWAKRYSGVLISSGIMNQKISGTGTNITAINNTNAVSGECIANHSTTNLDESLLSSGAAASLSIRIYTETLIDTQKPIWDIPLNTAPTAFIAKSALTANDLISSMKTNTSAGSSDSGKFATLNSNGYIDNTMLNFSSFSFSNSQITGLGNVCTMNSGTTVGTIPVLGTGGKLSASMLPTFQANRLMATDATGTMSGIYNTTQTSSGSSDLNKIPLLNASGKLDQSLIDSTNLPISPDLLNSVVSVSKGGTGSSNLTSNALLVGSGTSAISTLTPGPIGSIVVSNGNQWASQLPNGSNIVDMTSNQSAIGGNKTFTGSTTFSGSANLNGSFSLGNGGFTFQKILKCSVSSAIQDSGVETTSTCTGATTASVVHCSPTSAPTTGWIIGSARISTDHTLAIMPYLIAGTATWNTGYQCIVFVP
jgi:hypothetical protein